MFARRVDTPTFTDKVARFSGRQGRDGAPRCGRFYETPVSAIEDSPQTSARLSQPQLDEERTRYFEEPPPRWPQTSYSRGTLIDEFAGPSAAFAPDTAHPAEPGFSTSKA